MSTTNPVPSSAAEDLLFNAEALDRAVNSTAETYTDRLGISRQTLSGAIARIAAINIRGAWASSTSYALKDVVSNSGTWYVCIAAHVSSGSFSTDLAAKWRVYQGITTADLIASGGSALMGTVHPASGSVARLQSEVNADRIAITDFDADTAAADNLAAVNAALADAKAFVEVPLGDFTVSGVPTNTYGVELRGQGRLLRAIIGGNQKLNTYADTYQHVTGVEYLAAMHRRIIDGNGCNIVHTGDSTTAGTAAASGWTPTELMTTIAQARGMYFQKHWNRGQSGKSSADWQSTYVADDITNGGNTPHLIIARWGINDPTAGRTFAQYVASMRSCLTTIRATLSVSQCSILLMAPSSTSDTPNGRDEKWHEQVTPFLRSLAREFKCAFFDTYAWCKDSRGAAGIWMDDPYSDGRAIHPLDVMNAAIYGRVADIVYPIGLAPSATNKFQNLGASDVTAKTPADAPSTYSYGLTINRASPGGGGSNWPLDGAVFTIRPRDGTFVLQMCFSYNSSLTDLRWRIGQSSTWYPWAGGEMPFATLTDAATIAWDCSVSHKASVTLGGNRTLGLPTNMGDGAELVLRVVQDATGGRTLAYNSAFKWAGGSSPTVSAGANAVSELRWTYHAASGTFMEAGRFLGLA